MSKAAPGEGQQPGLPEEESGATQEEHRGPSLALLYGLAALALAAAVGFALLIVFPFYQRSR
jgi:hypothetical protein